MKSGISPRVCLLDHVYQPQELLDPDAGLAATELAGQLGDVFLGEGVTLKQEEIIMLNENRDIAIAMSSSRADPVLGFNILSYCPGWGYLNI